MVLRKTELYLANTNIHLSLIVRLAIPQSWGKSKPIALRTANLLKLLANEANILGGNILVKLPLSSGEGGDIQGGFQIAYGVFMKGS